MEFRAALKEQKTDEKSVIFANSTARYRLVTEDSTGTEKLEPKSVAAHH